MPCESFVNHYISTIKTGDWDSFRDKYRQIDVLLIDDVHFLANSQSTREEFFHTFNALYTRQKQIVLSSDCPPEEIPTIEERLISRFRWGLITRIDPPGFETSVAIIQKKTALLDMEISYEVACYLADNVVSSIREIEGTLTNIHRYAMMNESKIDLSLVKQIIRGFSKQKPNIGIEKNENYYVFFAYITSLFRYKNITYFTQNFLKSMPVADIYLLSATFIKTETMNELFLNIKEKSPKYLIIFGAHSDIYGMNCESKVSIQMTWGSTTGYIYKLR